MSESQKDIVSESESTSTRPALVPSYIWDLRFIDVARLVATWSKDPSTRVGAVAVGHRRRILAEGYNGFPAGMRDTRERLDDREVKYGLIVHAEDNIIFNACRHGVSLESSTIYIFGMYPCPECVKHLAQVGVARIAFMLGPSQNLQAWEEKWQLSLSVMKEVGIGHTQYKYRPFLQDYLLETKHEESDSI